MREIPKENDFFLCNCCATVCNGWEEKLIFFKKNLVSKKKVCTFAVEYVRSVAFLCGKRDRSQWAPGLKFCGKRREAVLRLVQWNLGNFINAQDGHTDFPTLWRRIVVFIYLCVKVVLGPHWRDVEYATILRFFVHMYDYEVRAWFMFNGQCSMVN